MNKYQECPVCLSKDIKDKYFVDGYTLAECSRCSVLFVKEIMTEDDLANLYIEDPTYADSNQRCLNYYYSKIKLYIEKQMPNKGKILDVGCSSGYFLNLMETSASY